jgi:hypothetical protein
METGASVRPLELELRDATRVRIACRPPRDTVKRFDIPGYAS